MLRWVLCLAFVVGIVLTSCGGDDSTSDGDAPEPEQDPVDVAIAEDALLEIQDFSQGWREQPRDDDEALSDKEYREIAEGISACRPYAPYVGSSLLPKSTARATSPSFVQDEAEVEHTVNVFENIADAEETFALFAREDFVECYQNMVPELIEQAFRANLESSQHVDEVTAEVGRAFAVEAGDEAFAIQIVMTYEAEALSVDVYLDLHLARVGRAMSGVTAENVFGPVSAQEQERLIQLGAQRLAHALDAV